MATLSFLGAAGTVTGSKFLVEHKGFKLLVDCGLFQGLKTFRQRNWSPPPVEPSELGAIILTHAHIDHSGYLPVMVREGFRGPVLATPSTCDLCGILLPDSGYLQEEDARHANYKGYSKHRPALPLFTEQEARDSLAYLRPLRVDQTVPVAEGIQLRLYSSGHILGAALAELRIGGKTIVFTGDLGRPNRPIIPDPAPLPECDHLVLESTYGDREHPAEDPKERLEEIIRDTASRGGTLLIPAFAVGRTQTLLYLLRELQQEGRLATDIPIHVDSPMAIHATRIFLDHPEAHDLEMRALNSHGKDPLGLRNIHLDSRAEDSKALNDITYPAIIISASGMCSGGRILHHLAYKLPDHRTTVLFCGYQAAGTRGRQLQEGATEVKIHGREVPVRARIETLDGLSAHADRREILEWLSVSKSRPRQVHLVHGEPPALDALAGLLREERSLDVHVAELNETVTL